MQMGQVVSSSGPGRGAAGGQLWAQALADARWLSRRASCDRPNAASASSLKAPRRQRSHRAGPTSSRARIAMMWAA